MSMCLIIGGEEEGHCSIVHRGIPHGGACPPGEGAHSIGDGQYPWPNDGGGVLELWPGGGQYPAGGGGGHVKVCVAVRDPPHGITGVGSV
jgi:hypothetical protein